MKRLAILVLVTLTSVLAPRGDGGSSPAAEPARTDVLAEFPIGDDKDPLIVPVTFRGRSYPFCIDTGASTIIYDKSFEDQLGPPSDTGNLVTATGKKIQTRWYAAPEAMLGPLSLRTDKAVTCADLALSGAYGGKRVYGLIGMSFLRKYALTLDFSHKKIQLRHEAAIDEAKAIPIRFDRLGRPLIDVTLPDEPPRAYLMDMGSYDPGGTLVDRATYDRLLRGNQVLSTYQTSGMDLSGANNGRTGEIRQAHIAGIKLSRVYVSDGPKDEFLLGLYAIRRLNLVLDFPREKMTVSRRPGWGW